ncbi:hypothetical protein [Phenylobacterium sp.]|uniref:hypothetical protein n=1 Tax=Phenylobacterium sp. TaxID=1871053 RepID=UPI00273485CE|nr:hypothetical protein [Phenylobacterium sp.]MDP3658488.1 hypothetical protein [Phenylobacterium sp.]
MSGPCARLLEIIARLEDEKGGAPLRRVQEQYGPGFDDAWVYARHRFYLQNGGDPQSLKLSQVGRLALD